MIEQMEMREVPSVAAVRPTFIRNSSHTAAAPAGVGFTPDQLRTAYGINGITLVNSTITGDGSGQAIAIVDYYNDPNIVSDLDSFDQNVYLSSAAKSSRITLASQYGAASSFLKVFDQNGNPINPSAETSVPNAPLGGWGVEISLDVEWAHAIAPGAKIDLIECATSVFTGTVTAAGLPGVSVVSMSWTSANSQGLPAEFSGENADDGDFVHPGVTFMGATGDSGTPGGYPAYSPNVVAVGGTSLVLNADNSYNREVGWSGSGGGTSIYENEPAYQNNVQTTGFRTVPDVAMDADSNTGVAIYDSYDLGTGMPWTDIGGTSAATPCWAGLIAIVNQGRIAQGAALLNATSPTQTQTLLYNLPSSDFHHNLGGSNGSSNAGMINPGLYNTVTGLGSPVASILVPDLASAGLIAISPSNLPAGQVGTAYSQTITASGGVGNINLTVNGSLPPGLTSTASLGQLVISGTPTAGGTYAFTVQATDSAAHVSSQNYTLTIKTHITAPVVVSNTSNLSTVTGSLPWAVAQVDADGSGTAVVIQFAAGPGQAFATAQTISLSGTLNIANTTPGESITIVGPAAGVTIQGGGSGSNFSVVTVGAGTTVALTGLTIANGAVLGSGGGIDNKGALTLTNDTITGNSAVVWGGGIYDEAGASLTLTNSTVASNSVTGTASQQGFGGGIFGSGAMTVSNDTFNNNIASYVGGGLYSAGTTVVSNSTFTANSAVFGGAIGNQSTLTVSYSTISGNSARSGGAGGGLANVSSVTLQNSIVSGNTAPTDPDINGNITTDRGHNLLGTALRNRASGTGDKFSDTPGLAALANNGGPTKTMALLSGSPALGSGVTVTGINTDQRGQTRASPPDIGAYEFNVPTPTIASVSPAAGAAGGGTQVTINGTNFGSAAIVTVNFGANNPAIIVSDTGTTLVVIDPAGSGTVDVTVTTAGGTSATSAADHFVYTDTPNVTAVNPAIGPLAGNTTVTITGSGFTNATQVNFGSSSAVSFVINSASQITAVSPAGTGTVDITVVGPKGTSTTSAADRFTYVGAPTVTGVSPSMGPLAGNATIIVTGSGFTAATQVAFGSNPASSFVINSATQISAVSPAGTGTVDVTVVSPGGTSTTSSADQYTYVSAPTVSAVSPTTGPAAGNTTVTITGSGFITATQVNFGSNAASSFVINSATQITAVSPAGAAGTVDITVIGPGGTSGTSAVDHFTYLSAPTVTAVNPASGPLAGNTTVTIIGSSFTTATQVNFGSKPAASFVISSNNQIIAVSPAGTGTVDITVVGPQGTSTTSAADHFTYVSAPTVTGVSPSSGLLAGNTTVTITGSGFTGATQVNFGSNPASSFVVNSATQITAVSPAGAVGTVDITVVSPGGTSTTSSADQFTYVVLIDNGQAGYSEVGAGWTTFSGGYGGNFRYDAAGDGTQVASYTIGGLTPGSYEIDVTWVADPNRATNAPYRIYDGTTLLQTIRINQKNAPVGTTVNGFVFQTLALTNITSGTVRIDLGNDANGFVIADAVRVVPLPPPVIDLNWSGGGIAGPATASTLSPFTINRTYTISGAPATTPFTISYYASTDAVFGNADDVLLGSETITAAADETVGSHTGTSPALTLATRGTYYLFAMLDSGGAILETNETNNAAQAPTQVIVSGPVIVDNGQAGYSEVGAGWTTFSGGYGGNFRYDAAGDGTQVASYTIGGLTPGSYEIDVTWVADPNRATNAPYRIYDGTTLLQTIRINQKNAPVGTTVNGFVFQTLALTNITSGTVRIDLGNDANGFVIADAVRVVPLPPPVIDLNWTGGGIAGPTTANTQSSFTMNRTYTISGAPATTNFTISYYASTDAVFGNADDVLVGSETITAAADETVGSHTGTSPALTLANRGTYYLFAMLDSGGAILETNETNNLAQAPSQVVVTGPVLVDNGQAGYSEVGTGWTTYTGGYGGNFRYDAAGTGSQVASWTIGGLTPGSYEIDVTWVADPNRATNAPYRIYDGTTLLQTVRINQKNAPVGATVNGFVFQTLILTNITSGTVRIDLGNDANGYVIADAVRVVPLPPPVIDLNWSAGGIAGPATASTQSTFTMSRTYTISGAPATTPFTISYYASSDAVFGNADDVLLGSETITAAADEAMGSHTGTSPALTLANRGTYYLFAMLDTGGAILETNETNNVAQAPTQVVVSGPVIVDNGQAGYSEVGAGWTTFNGGYGGNFRYDAAGDGTQIASWTIGGLTPGSYEIDVTWVADPNRATNAPYRVYDGTTLLQTIRINQKNAPVGTTVNGFVFQSLATINITSGTVRIDLGNDANAFVIADAVRVVPVNTSAAALLATSTPRGGTTPASSWQGPGARPSWTPVLLAEQASFPETSRSALKVRAVDHVLAHWEKWHQEADFWALSFLMDGRDELGKRR